MQLTVVIPTHRRNDLLRRTLASLAECERPEEYARTVVVENGGRHGAEDVVRRAPPGLNVEYVYHNQGNKSAALNRVLEHVGGGLLVFFDDDVRVDPAALTAYAAAASGRRAFFGGPVECDYDVVPEEWIVLPCSARGWAMPPDTDVIKRPDFLGFNWAAYCADLRAAGGFNPEVGPGGTSGSRGQETEMQSRLMRMGLEAVYVANARVWHYVPRERCSVKWSLRRAYQNSVWDGLNRATPGPVLFGYPRWTVRELARRYLKRLAALCKSPEERYRARYECELVRGFMHGAKVAKKRQKGSSSAIPPAPPSGPSSERSSLNEELQRI